MMSEDFDDIKMDIQCRVFLSASIRMKGFRDECFEKEK